MKTAAEKWLTGMDGISLSDAYATDLFQMWLDRPMPQWRTMVDSNYLPTDAHHLTNLGCLLSVRSVTLYNVETDKNAIEIHYLGSGPSREKLVIQNAVQRRQIPANWVESSGGRGMEFWFRFEPSVGLKSHVLLTKDNPIARSEAIETGVTQWQQVVTERAIMKDHEFFRKFQLYGYEPLRVMIDGKILIQDQSLEAIIETSRTFRAPPETSRQSKPLRFSTWYDLFVKAGYSENTSERAFRDWLKPHVGKTAFRETRNGPISFALEFLEQHGVIVPE